MQHGRQTSCRHTHTCNDDYLSKLFMHSFYLYNVDSTVYFAVRDESHSATEKYLVSHDCIYFSDKHLLGLSLFQLFDATAWQLFCQAQQACTSRNTKTFTHSHKHNSTNNQNTHVHAQTQHIYASQQSLSHTDTHTHYTHAHKVYTNTYKNIT